MAERAYLSIGEVLSLLQAEFPEVTISKIRFLESQGLLDPERTPSGYRKFYDDDVDRLRWILRQQRENFLPLKVIKGRLLGRHDDVHDDAHEGAREEAHEGEGGAPEVGERPASGVAPGSEPSPAAPPAVPEREHEPEPAGPVAKLETETTPSPLPEPPPRHIEPERSSQRRLSVADLPLAVSGTALTLDELAAASGQSADQVRDLERAGFIAGRSVADVVYYDEECVAVVELVARFARFGIEPRHLRIYKNSAEREAGLFQQVIVPLLKQRNPDARQRAVDTLQELSELGERLRATMLRQAIKSLTGG